MSIARVSGQWGKQVAVAAAPNLKGVAPPTGAAGTVNNERFEALTKYVPTETITIFVALMSALQAIAKLKPNAFDMSFWAWIIYVACAILTPVLVWAIAYAAFREAARKTGAANDSFVRPTFRMIAATIAFLIWALAVPGLLDSAIGQILAGVGAVVVSTFLSLGEKIFE
ncbi:MAG: hypothetical protein QOD40_2537 [Alphaproteobacteria bacterium]|jgi:multisubunit Na+/H+ antiporter MnhG subunit|nr:hypothetical protein [Alphaproteobacteria bacterium]